MEAAAADWGGWLNTYSTLQLWGRWLFDNLKHSHSNSWASTLSEFLTTADPLASAVVIALLVAAVCFLLSLPTNNHSFVDKLWSFLPAFYAWRFALHDKVQHATVPLNPRLIIIAVLTTIWGTRLTYNFARKGGYRWRAEDYRWPYVRSKVSAPIFLLFNLTFIAVYQNLLLLSLATPAYLAWQNVGTPLNALDAVAAGLCLFFIIFEGVADQQQWVFQTAKHAKLAAGKRLTGVFAKGFITSGLFKYSRHPNFWAEQSLWCSMYLFGVAASGRWLNWTLAAPLQLILLFQGSTRLTEHMSAQKYPEYKKYQATTSIFLPLPPRDSRPQKPARATSTGKKAAAKQAQAAKSTPRTPASAQRDAAAVGEPAGTATPAITLDFTTEDEAQDTPASTRRRGGRAQSEVTTATATKERQEAAPAESTRSTPATRKAGRGQAKERSGPVRQSSRLRSKAATTQ